MPPRKKAAAATDGSAPAPKRSSSRVKAAAPATSQPAAQLAKGTGKRAHPDTDDEQDETAAKPKSAAKKSKKAKKEDNDADAADDEPTVDDKPAKMVTVCLISCVALSHARPDMTLQQVLKRGSAPVDPFSGKVGEH
jgi:hypothetical protein